jgi:hypothetical protein
MARAGALFTQSFSPDLLVSKLLRCFSLFLHEHVLLIHLLDSNFLHFAQWLCTLHFDL